MTAQPFSPARPPIGIAAIIAIGFFVALVSLLALSLVRPAVLAFAFGGIVILIPTLMMRDQRAYWLFLLALSIPFEVSKRTTSWLVEPWDLFDKFGLPASGIYSLDVYVTDVVLLAMLLPWLARLCLRRDRFYFPKIGYLFVLYLAWALIVALVEAESLYLSIFEWCREVLFFLAFIYLANNVVTRAQFRAIVLALFVGVAIESVAVIAFFDLGIGTETNVYADVYRVGTNKANRISQSDLTEGRSGSAAQVKRSAGTFVHPGHAAYYFEYTLLIVFGYLVAASRNRERIVSGALFAAGCAAMYLTFSRSGLVGLAFGIIVFTTVARWSQLISRRAFAWCIAVFLMLAAASSPLIIKSMVARPESVGARVGLIEAALTAVERRPILGAGLNFSSQSVMEGAQGPVIVVKGRRMPALVVHNHYLIVLLAVGVVGFVLFFAFFWQVIAIALRSLKASDVEMKRLLVGLVGALAAIALHNFADPFGGHAIQAMLWLYTGLIIAIARQVRAERASVIPAAPAIARPMRGRAADWL